MTRTHLAALAAALFAATNARAADAAPTWDKDVLPLFAGRCFGCHGTDNPKGGLDLRTRAATLAGGEGGPAVKPGSLKDSRLWQYVSTDKMPAKPPALSDAEKELLRKWIQAGAPGDGVAARAAASNAAAGAAVKRGVKETARAVDAAVERRLAAARVAAAAPSGDAEFLRRASLDITGTIPSTQRAAEFLDSTDPDKWAKLVDELLARPEFGTFTAGHWAALMTPDAPQNGPKLEAWLAEAFNAGRPWDATVRQLLTATGRGDDTLFVRSQLENNKLSPDALASATGRLFLGQQLQCARCHNHPFTALKQKDFWAFAAFFGRVKEFSTEPVGLGERAPPQLPPRKGAAPPKDAALIAVPADAGRAAGALVVARFLDGTAPADLPASGPLRPALADWVTSRDNPYFAAAAVNRLWARFMGRGLVVPVDDLSEENVPSHPEVLQTLADEFRASGFDTKHLVRCICATQAYQRTSRPSPGRPADPALFSTGAVKVMAPESLYDALVQSTGLKNLQFNAPAVRRGSRGPRDTFVQFFRTSPLDADPTAYSGGVPQALGLLNTAALNRPTPAVARLAGDKLTHEQAVERLYLAALSRRPTADEARAAAAFVAKRPDPAAGYAGVLWALVNSPEFVLVP